MQHPEEQARDRTVERTEPQRWKRRRTHDWRYPLSGAARQAAELGPYETRYDVREGYAEYHRLRRR